MLAAMLDQAQISISSWSSQSSAVAQTSLVGLREAPRGMGVPIDLIVVNTEHVPRWGSVQGTLMHEALRDGRVLTGT